MTGISIPIRSSNLRSGHMASAPFLRSNNPASPGLCGGWLMIQQLAFEVSNPNGCQSVDSSRSCPGMTNHHSQAQSGHCPTLRPRRAPHTLIPMTTGIYVNAVMAGARPLGRKRTRLANVPSRRRSTTLRLQTATKKPI